MAAFGLPATTEYDLWACVGIFYLLSARDMFPLNRIYSFTQLLYATPGNTFVHFS